MSIRKISLTCLILHTEYLIIMNLSVFELAYLGSQLKDTAHLGKSNIIRFATSQFVTDATDWIWMRLLGFLPQPDWPLANVLWLMESANTQRDVPPFNPNGSLLLAQPVFFSLQRDSFALESVVSLSVEEYQSITETLNHHFQQENIQFIPSKTHQYWLMHTPEEWQVSTSLVQSVLRQNIKTMMPQGPDANKLRQISNQVQMLLHEHPVNQRRLKQSKVEVNSVWLSGNSLLGQFPKFVHPPSTALLGENVLSHAISSAFSIPIYPDAEVARASGIQHAVMLLDAPESAPWDSLYQAVKTRHLDALNVYCPAGNGTLQLTLKPLDCLKFWRKPTTLNDRIMQHVQNH